VGEEDVGFRSKLCVFFGLDRSSVYRQRKQSAKDKLLAAQIRAVCLEHPGYGHRRIADELKPDSQSHESLWHSFAQAQIHQGQQR
jgi:hypothetical protein